MAVVVGHLRELFFVDAPALGPKPGLLTQAVYAVTGLGHEAVMVFFVLSGFLVGSSVLQAWRQRSWSWAEYLTRRLSRLWTVLLPALLLCALLDILGIHLFGSGGLYGGHQRGQLAIDFAVAPRLHPSVLLGNALFLQTIVTPTFGSDGSLWSLANEFWYYILFPLALGVAGLSPRLIGRLISAVLTGALIWFVGPQIAGYFALWLMGAAVAAAWIWRAELFRPEAKAPLIILGVISVVVALTLVRGHRFPSIPVGDAAVGLSFTLLLVGLLCPSRRVGAANHASGTYSSIANSMADRSYTLYLVHLPLLAFVAAWLVPDRRWMPGAPHLAIALILAGVVGIYAFAVAELTERRTALVRRWALRRLSSVRRPRADGDARPCS